MAEVLVDAVVERLASLQDPSSPWMTRAEAAEHLSVPVSRLEKDKTVPAHRWEGRILYNRGDFDEWLRGMAA